MNNFVLLSDFPNNAKAIGPVFSALVYYSFDKEAYFTLDDELLGGIHINEEEDSNCNIGTPLFVVSTVNDKGMLVKSDENAFYQSIFNGSSGLESHIIMEPKAIVNGKIKYTNFSHEKYTTLRHGNWATFATKGTIRATKYTT